MTLPLTIPGPTFEDILRTGYVLRWHTRPMAQMQTLADHLAKVGLLADRLGRHLPERYDDQVAYETLLLALQHDLSETEHGDIPNPAKKWLNDRLGDRYDDLVALDWWRGRGLTDPPLYADLADLLVRVADILEAAARYWVYGLDPDIKAHLVFETATVTRRLLPELLPVVAEALAAAGVPAVLISEAAA